MLPLITPRITEETSSIGRTSRPFRFLILEPSLLPVARTASREVLRGPVITPHCIVDTSPHDCHPCGPLSASEADLLTPRESIIWGWDHFNFAHTRTTATNSKTVLPFLSPSALVRLNRRLQAYIDMTPFKKSHKGHIDAEFVEHANPAKPSSLPILLQDLSEDEIKILEKKMIRKVDWRMLPLIILMYILVRLRVASVFVFHGRGGS